jgi:hypothetical protein
VRENTVEPQSGGVHGIQADKPAAQIAQLVTYKTSIIDKVSDVFDNLNVRLEQDT